MKKVGSRRFSIIHRLLQVYPELGEGDTSEFCSLFNKLPETKKLAQIHIDYQRNSLPAVAYIYEMAATNMSLSAFISLFFISVNCCFGQTTKEQDFKTTTQKIITAFSKQDSLGIAKFIKKDIGVYQLFRLGVYDNFEHYKTLGFSDSIAEKGFFRDIKGIKILPLTYLKLPVYSCENEMWSKKGLFVDTTKVDHMLSKICKDRNKNVPDNISNKRIQFFHELENKSRRIILYDTKEIELVFYLSFINNKWYLTIIDNATSDCSV